MPTWTDIGIDYRPYGLGTETFDRSREGIPASALHKSSPSVDSAPQELFMQMLHGISERRGLSTIPALVRFGGERCRMDRGCVGHAVATVLIEPPFDGPGGIIEQVTLIVVPDSVAS